MTIDDTRAPEDLAELYRDLHRNPELSFQEERTAGIVATRLRELGYETTTGVGRTGVVGVLRNGDGPTALLRADMDALPMQEKTGLPYASTVRGVDHEGHAVDVFHACGHDVHVACLVGAAAELAADRRSWSGTALLVFQPAEEVGRGAQAMIDDGLFTRFGHPDVVLGQHVAPLPAGVLALRSGPAFAAADGVKVTMFGQGGHGSRPETTVDPVVMAAATVMRLQTVVSREVAGTDTAVVTIGALRAGTKENIIPDDAELLLSIRTFEPLVRDRVLEAIGRIVRAEAAASGARRSPKSQPSTASRRWSTTWPPAPVRAPRSRRWWARTTSSTPGSSPAARTSACSPPAAVLHACSGCSGAAIPHPSPQSGARRTWPRWWRSSRRTTRRSTRR
jgi:amidohydrolase